MVHIRRGRDLMTTKRLTFPRVLHCVMAFHGGILAVYHVRAASVVVGVAWGEGGRLSHYALTLDDLFVTLGVLDDPATTHQLTCLLCMCNV